MMLSVNEIVLDESRFVSTHPHLVVNDPEKVQTRYLIFSTKDKKLKEGKSDVTVKMPLEGANYHTVPEKYQIYDGDSRLGGEPYRLSIPKDTFPSGSSTTHKKVCTSQGQDRS
jgi:hypothetical protein